jgi:hypothetical protein
MAHSGSPNWFMPRGRALQKRKPMLPCRSGLDQSFQFPRNHTRDDIFQAKRAPSYALKTSDHFNRSIVKCVGIQSKSRAITISWMDRYSEEEEPRYSLRNPSRDEGKFCSKIAPRWIELDLNFLNISNNIIESFSVPKISFWLLVSLQKHDENGRSAGCALPHFARVLVHGKRTIDPCPWSSTNQCSWWQSI